MTNNFVKISLVDGLDLSCQAGGKSVFPELDQETSAVVQTGARLIVAKKRASKEWISVRIDGFVDRANTNVAPLLAILQSTVQKKDNDCGKEREEREREEREERERRGRERGEGEREERERRGERERVREREISRVCVCVWVYV